MNKSLLEITPLETESKRQLAAFFITSDKLYKSNENLFPDGYGMVVSIDEETSNTHLVLDARGCNNSKYLWQLNKVEITGYGEDHDDYLASWSDSRQVWQLDLSSDEAKAIKYSVNRQGSISKTEVLDPLETITLIQEIDDLINSEEFIEEKDKRAAQKADALRKLNEFSVKYPGLSNNNSESNNHYSNSRVTELKKLTQTAKTAGYLVISPLIVS